MKNEKNIRQTSAFKLFLHSYNRLMFTYWENLIFETIYKLLAMVVFIPMISMIFNGLLSIAGFKAITNNELLRFGFSRYGFLTVLILLPIAIILIFLEFSMLIIISYYSNKGKRVLIGDAFIKSLGYLPSIFKYGILGIATYLLLLVPLLNIGIGSTLLPSIEIPNFISGELFKTTTGIISYTIVFAIIIYLNIRWIYSLHIIVLEGNNNFRAAAKKSSKMVKGNYFKIALRVLVSIFIYVLFMLLLISLLAFVLILIYLLLSNIIAEESVISSIITSIFFALVVIAFYISTSVITPFYINLITKLYLDRCDKNKINIEKKNIKTADDNTESFLVKYKKSFVVFLLLPFVIISFVLPIVIDPFEGGYTDLVIMAHRGSSLHGVENTLEAIEGAINEKADYAEIDVIQTKDNELVVIHDFNLKRLGKVNANISDLTLDEIREVTLKQGDFTGKISTLDEIIKFSKGKMKLNIEVKLHGDEEDFVNKFIGIIKDNNFIDQCVVQSTYFPILKEIKKAEPKLKVGYIIYAGLPKVEFMEVDFLTIEESLVTDKIIHASRLLNKPIYVWTVNSKSSMENFYLLGVDGIVTDDVPTAKEVVAEMKEN